MKPKGEMKSPSLTSGHPANHQGGNPADQQGGKIADQQGGQPNRQSGQPANQQGAQLAGSCRGRASVRNPIIRNPSATIILQRTLSLNCDCGGRGATRPTEGAARDWEAQ